MIILHTRKKHHNLEVCWSCKNSGNENMIHLVSQCDAYSEIRERIKPQYKDLCLKTQSTMNFENIEKDDITFCQFVLDPTSMSLRYRVNFNDPILEQILQLSRDYCYAIHVRRLKILEEHSNKLTSTWCIIAPQPSITKICMIEMHTLGK